ncbi:DNA polymerase III subunit epsilon [Muricoccus pecuniae]|uniref:DNA polymerase III subunit epsilon n=1 Tax=Muricoccus pecuniae TaxID=693023 RepID=A0A840Y5Y6_9PROT|nr:DNA polymerase III subunit epsilon [Roseomonas pecuniae]MBB5694189.1 DNA polymerase-3 subunit epsilon [Roseomonas pecuniae]
MTRALILDTETTGLDPATGDRVLEVAAIEVVNLMPTGRSFHRLINPQRDIPPEASKVHGFTAADLVDKPLFAEILPELLGFLGEDPVIAHNAPFDFNFLDHEFDRCGTPRIPRSRMVDTLAMAKKRFPGLPNSLDALCRRFGIDLSARTTHNALLDVQLLGQVYLELMGGKQPGLALASSIGGRGPLLAASGPAAPRTPRPIAPSPEELERHAAFVAKLKDPVWAALDGG